MAIINKFIISVYQDGFTGKALNRKSITEISDGRLIIKLSNGFRSYNLQKVSQYAVRFETEE